MATLTSIAPPPVVVATPAASPAPLSDARSGAVHADGPHRGSFASALSRVDGRHVAPRPQPTAPAQEDPATAAPPAAGPGAAGGKAGKKAATAGGDASPPDGSALPLVDAQLAAAATAAASTDPSAADAAAGLPAGAAAAAPSPDANPAQPPPPPASGLVRPAHATPTDGEFRALADRGAGATAPVVVAPSAMPTAATPPPLPARFVAAVAPPPPKPVSITDEFSMKTTPWRPTPAGIDGAAVATETARALAPVFAMDTGTGTNAQGGSPLGDGKPDANAAIPAALAPPVPSLGASPVVAQIATPVGSPDWPQQLGDCVAVLVNQNLTSAQIKLSPAHLGPLEIRIAVSDGQANISFTSHSQATREALEAAAPKLREMLGGQGFANVSVDVSQQQFRERTPQSTRYEPEFSFATGATPAAAASGTSTPSTARATASALRLDAYA